MGQGSVAVDRGTLGFVEGHRLLFLTEEEAQMSRGVNSQDGYLEAMVKNMPSETVAGYLAIVGMTSGAGNRPEWILWLIWALFLVATPFYLWLVKPRTETGPRPWWQVWIFSPIAFFIWSLTSPGPWQTVDKAALAGGVLVILFSVVIFPLVSMAIARASR